MTAPHTKETLRHIQTLFYLDKCTLENGSLEANSIATLSSVAVPVSNSTSQRLESVPLASFGPIATTEVLRQPQSSLGLIASGKGWHQSLSSLDTASLDNNHTAPFLTTPSPTCAAASTLTDLPAKHLGKTEGEALETARSPSARLQRMWQFARHRASRQPSQDRQRCAPLRPESSQLRWLLRYLVRRSRIPRCCPLRQQIPEQRRVHCRHAPCGPG